MKIIKIQSGAYLPILPLPILPQRLSKVMNDLNDMSLCVLIYPKVKNHTCFAATPENLGVSILHFSDALYL